MKMVNTNSLAQLCLSASANYNKHLALAMLNDGKVDRRITYTQMGKRCRQIASILAQLGIKKGDRILLLSDNCPEWALSYFGIALAGAVSVPLLTGFSTEQIQNISTHSGISAICLGRPYTSKFDEMEATPEIKKLPFIYIDSITELENSDMEITVSINGSEKQMLAGQEEIVPQQEADDLATIIYTSGTSGNSKGVMLSSKNIISSSLSSKIFVDPTTKDRALSLLPLAHSYECSLGFLAMIIGGASITYLDRPPSASVLLPAVQLVRPTMMLSVPLLIEKVYNNGIAPKLLTNKLYKFPLTRQLARLVAGKKLYKSLGGKLRFFGIGGAPLSPAVEDFLYHSRFPYSIGYGLTESAPLVAGNAPLGFSNKYGLGPAAGVKMRIAKCPSCTEEGIGEIQVSGPNVMLGYYNDKEKTAEVMTSDGWLRTGDLGWLDKKGKVHIRGRLKALILGPSGENIYPEEIEGLLGTSHLVEDALVYSSNKGELVAKVRLSEAAKALTVAAEKTLEELRAWANKKLAVFSHLTRIELQGEPFEKTPTMKIKRYLYV